MVSSEIEELKAFAGILLAVEGDVVAPHQSCLVSCSLMALAKSCTSACVASSPWSVSMPSCVTKTQPMRSSATGPCGSLLAERVMPLETVSNRCLIMVSSLSVL
jgi:hypothetical protein